MASRALPSRQKHYNAIMRKFNPFLSQHPRPEGDPGRYLVLRDHIGGREKYWARTYDTQDEIEDDLKRLSTRGLMAVIDLETGETLEHQVKLTGRQLPSWRDLYIAKSK